jgi:dienelactone hydrolase
VLLVLDYLLSRADVDSARVELVGASFGTPFATIAAALDERVTRLWSVHGAGEPYTLMSHNLQRRLPWAPARATVAGLANLLAAGPRMAPERWISRIAPRPFIMINATEDERLPRDAVMTLFDSARNPKEIIWLPGMHVQSNRTEILQGLVRTVLERAARDR